MLHSQRPAPSYDPIPTEQRLRKVWLSAAVLLAVFLGNFCLRIRLDPTRRMWLLFEALVLLSSLGVVVHQRSQLDRRPILLAALLGTLVAFAYLGLGTFSVHQITVGVITFATALASLLVFRVHRDHAIAILHNVSGREVLTSIVIGLGAGVLLGTANLWLMRHQGTWSASFSWRYVQVALSPGIFEEVAFRMFPAALVLQFLKGRQETTHERLALWVLMIVPHALIHTPGYFIKSPLNGLITTMVLCVLFGLPFAWLQRKRDLTSAMVAHGVVDLLRFIFLGLPH